MNFVGLFQSLDASQSTHAKRDALIAFLEQGDAVETALAVSLLTGRKQQRTLKPAQLKQVAGVLYQETPWLFDECYQAVGDLSETLAILCADGLQDANTQDPVLSAWSDLQQQLLQIHPDALPTALYTTLQQLSRDEAFLFLKTASGGFRVGVSRGLVHDALAKVTGMSRDVIDERLMDGLTVSRDWLSDLQRPLSDAEQHARPCPFLLAHPLPDNFESTLSPSDYVVEYKWDGIRAQLIKTDHIIRLWSRGDHDITTQFPEIIEAASSWPGQLTLDGEILIVRDEGLGSFHDLQTRLNRKRVTKTLLASHPARFRAYDLLKLNGVDLREQPLIKRKAQLDTLAVEQSPWHIHHSWLAISQMRDQSRSLGAEGLMLKAQAAAYQGGRKSGVWWKWKLDPMTADLVLIYAQAGHGRRASLHTDYTLAAWSENTLVPVAKAYSGLTDDELKTIDRWIKAHTTDKFGPVRQVEAELVFEIGFEGIARSSRHKSGIALRFPRILRWRTDLTPADADSLSYFNELLEVAR